VRNKVSANRLCMLLPALLALTAFASSQVVPQTFEGIDATAPGVGGTFDVDPNGAIGTKQYLEWTNPVYQAYSKTAPFQAVFASPIIGDTPWAQNNMSDCAGNSGDVVILFDHLASRWVIARRQGQNSYFYCLAVSSTDDLAASGLTWFAYELSLDSLLGQNSQGHTYFPDYPRIGSWPDAFYVSIDLEDPDSSFKEVGTLVCAFDRTNMISGGAARAPQCFRYPNPLGGLFLEHSLLPADVDGVTPPPAAAVEYFISIQNPAFNSSNTLNLWQFHVDWTTPANSTFTGPVAVKSGSYVPGCYWKLNRPNTVCVPEPSTSSTGNSIDSVGDRVMQRFAYRNFRGSPSYQSYLVTHTVQVGLTSRSQTGIRWHELRFVTGALSVVHSGTINPGDSNYRFMPSIAQDKVGNLAVGYSVAGTTLSPSIRASYANLRNHLAPTEFSIMSGTADEENSTHWGDYTSMTVDPVDDCTFWYVNEYFTTNQITMPTWQTRIANFKIPTCK
jgi:hypothetical protein